ncbi:MAG: hypothetical protein ACOWWR_17515 [Eubacteriales bacterium]
MKYFLGGITIKEKELFDIISKVNQLKEKDDAIYHEKIEELKNTIGKDKVEKKLKEIDAKYGNQLNDYVQKIQKFSKNASSEEKGQMVLEMKNKLSPEDQKKFDQTIKMLKKYMNHI